MSAQGQTHVTDIDIDSLLISLLIMLGASSLNSKKIIYIPTFSNFGQAMKHLLVY